MKIIPSPAGKGKSRDARMSSAKGSVWMFICLGICCLGGCEGQVTNDWLLYTVPNRTVPTSQGLREVVLVFNSSVEEVFLNNATKATVLTLSKAIPSAHWSRVFSFNLSRVGLAETEGRVIFELPSEFSLEYRTRYSFHVASVLMENERFHGLSFNFTTEPNPAEKAIDQPNVDTVVTPKELRVYGVGMYLLDVGEIDMKKGTFSAHFQLYMLEFYRSFEDMGTARKEAMNPHSRACVETTHGEKFRFLKNVTAADMLKKLNFINPASALRINAVFDESLELFDHFMVQGTWRFSPETSNYPFQDQQLPITLEHFGESVSPTPMVLLCSLDSFSGFARNLSSFATSGREFDEPLLSAKIMISEKAFWPPLDYEEAVANAEFHYPVRFFDQRPTRISSRFSMVVTYRQSILMGALEIATSMFVALSPLLTYLLPVEEFRAKLSACTAALLAAVVQHSSLRNRIPQRSSVTNTDFAMLVVYIIISLAFSSAVLSSMLLGNRKLKRFAQRTNRVLRVFGLYTPIFFIIFLPGLRPNRFSSWLVALCVQALLVILTLLCSRHIARCTESMVDTMHRNFQSVQYERISQSKTPERLNEMSSADLLLWLENIGSVNGIPQDSLLSYADILRAEEIDGESVQQLTPQVRNAYLVN